MKGALFAIATAAAVGLVSASERHGNHQHLHKKNEDILDRRTGTEDENKNGTNCGCTTMYETIYGEPTRECTPLHCWMPDTGLGVLTYTSSHLPLVHRILC